MLEDYGPLDSLLIIWLTLVKQFLYAGVHEYCTHIDALVILYTCTPMHVPFICFFFYLFIFIFSRMQKSHYRKQGLYLFNISALMCERNSPYHKMKIKC